MNKKILKFNFYGDFHQMNYIYGDCGKDLTYIRNDDIDGAPIFEYRHNIDYEIINDIDKLNLYLRELKLRHLIKKDLSDDELSMYTFFKFYIKSKKEFLIRSIRPYYFTHK